MTLLVGITLLLAVVAVLAAIVVVAIGGGGELSVEHPDHPPLALPGRRPVAGTDAALLRLPLGLWGYHKQITDEALERFAYELTERDTRIAVLEQQLAEARQGAGGHPRARAALPAAPPDRHGAADDPLATRADRLFGGTPEGGDPLATRTDRPSSPPVTHEETLPVREREDPPEVEDSEPWPVSEPQAAASERTGDERAEPAAETGETRPAREEGSG